MSLKILFWQVVTYILTKVREPTYDVVKSAIILNGKIYQSGPNCPGPDNCNQSFIVSVLLS